VTKKLPKIAIKCSIFCEDNSHTYEIFFAYFDFKFVYKVAQDVSLKFLAAHTIIDHTLPGVE
jgi:predicted nucleic acid binding AN1-type Zn finger protein